MGVLGVAIIYGIYSFFKMISALARWNAWKSKAVSCKAVVAGIANRINENPGKKGVTYYQYALDVEYGGQWVRAFFEETVAPKGTPRFLPGAQTVVLYDPVSHGCRDPQDLKGAIKAHGITLLTCIVVGIVCIVVVQLING